MALNVYRHDELDRKLFVTLKAFQVILIAFKKRLSVVKYHLEIFIPNASAFFALDFALVFNVISHPSPLPLARLLLLPRLLRLALFVFDRSP